MHLQLTISNSPTQVSAYGIASLAGICKSQFSRGLRKARTLCLRSSENNIQLADGRGRDADVQQIAAHQGGQGLRTEFSAPEVQYMRDEQPARFWGLNGSASRKDRVVTLTIVNPDLSKTVETQIALRGAAISSASGTVLAARDMHAHNTFDQPNAVTPATLAVALRGDLLNVSIPAASVTRVDVVMG